MVKESDKHQHKELDKELLMEQLSQNNFASFIMERQQRTILQYELYENASEMIIPINSCTKSVVSAIYCIGLGEGWLPDVDTPIVEWFPELQNSEDKRKLSITVEHVLTLSAGFRWNEFGGNKDFPKMTRTDHWLKYALEQPLTADPGTSWAYNSGISQLLSAIIRRASGRDLAELAEQKLFEPLGIKEYRWKQDPEGYYTGGFGLELTALDMFKFGRLFLQEGKWNGQQLIASQCCKQATTPYIEVEAPEVGFYGWHWWCDLENGLPFYYARGYGGQFIIIVPSKETVVVFTRNQKHKASSPLELFRKLICPYLNTN